MLRAGYAKDLLSGSIVVREKILRSAQNDGVKVC